MTVLTSDVQVDGVDGVHSGDGFDVRRQLRLHDPPPGHEAPRRRRLPAVVAANHRALQRALRTRPDVVSVWHMGGVSLTLLRHLAMSRRPVVYVVCDDWMRYAPPADPIASRLGRAVLPDLGRVAATTFCSDSLRTSVQATTAWSFPTSTIVGLGVDLDDFPLCPPRTGPWRWLLLYVGRLDPAKGVHTLVRALVHLPDATLRLAATGSPAEVADVLATARVAGCEERVLVDSYPRSELAGVYRSSDVLVFPSEWEEPFGIVPLEAMAAATPVVATGTGGSASYLRHETNCLQFRPGDPAGLAAAVQRLADDDSLRRRLVEGGRVTAAATTTDHVAAALEQVHLRAAERGR